MEVLLIVILLFAVALYVFKGVVIVQQQQEVIIENLGRYKRTLTAGLNFIIPIIEAPRGILKKVSQKGMDGRKYYYIKSVDKIDLREQMYDLPSQSVVTKDNVKIDIDAVMYFQIIKSKSAVYEIENLPDAIEQLTLTTMRNLVGQMDLQDTLTSRDKINVELRTILDAATDKWGLKVNRVELKEIMVPTATQNEMDKLIRADRDKPARVTEAEGIKEAALLNAEGEREAAIRTAEGAKQAEILRAEGIAKARIIEAEAEKEAIFRIINALEGKGQPDKYLIAMKYLETMKDITSGKDNKVVYMPYEATGILSSVDGIKQMFDKK